MVRGVGVEMVKVPFACSECHIIIDGAVEQCSYHPGAPVSTDWQGYVVVTYPDRSDIAKRLNVKRSGAYALKVNIR